MYQQLTLIGNLGRDPEMRYTPTGVPVTNFSIAVSRSWVGQDGRRQEKTLWFRVTAWRKLAETASQYLTKGSKVLVVGELEAPTTYTDRDGQSGSRSASQPRQSAFSPHTGRAMGQKPAPAGHGPSDEDIPF
jgi:single-strand DNA-binding protein